MRDARAGRSKQSPLGCATVRVTQPTAPIAKPKKECLTTSRARSFYLQDRRSSQRTILHKTRDIFHDRDIGISLERDNCFLRYVCLTSGPGNVTRMEARVCEAAGPGAECFALRFVN